MTEQEKLTAVREWIVKACPDVLELREGCEVETISEAGFCNFSIFLKRTAKGFYAWSSELGYARQLPKSALGMIRGQKIGIAEVLRTLWKKGSYIVLEADGTLRTVAEIVNEHQLRFWNRTCEWNLSDNNLAHQKPETIDFLFSLIP